MPSARRAAIQVEIAAGSKQSWVVMYVAKAALACSAASSGPSAMNAWPGR